jgi:hypothetical protein
LSITITINSETQCVYATISGDIHLSAFAGYMQTLARQNLISYSQLIDAREASIEMTTTDLRAFVEFMKQYRQAQNPTRVAFVTANDTLYGMMRMYMAYSEGYDPGFNVFRDIEEAEQWIRL